ncbi:MAG TPA: Ku protein [Syntrophorhabdaceae bacterium]|nr:Ku protein [Syntrophorhabdaceae bacterium]HOD74802.1 Ku protein [Syntrophorhabdaceae bacterium]
MVSRALWKGQIHFGDFDVPVKLHTAVREQRIQFHLLHSRDHVRLRQHMLCAYEKVPVPREEQVRGFEVGEGRYIIVDDDELERLEPEGNRTIEIHDFVRGGQIDPLYFDRVYYLAPDVMLRGYRALAEALGETGMEGICTWTMRKRSYLGSLAAKGKAMRLITLRHADEVIDAGSLDLPVTGLSDRELEAGVNLVTALSAPFQPEKFKNDHQKKLRELIDRKAAGEKISILRPRQRRATPPDRLLETLEASLKKAV